MSISCPVTKTYFKDTFTNRILIKTDMPRQWFFRYKGSDYGLFLSYQPNKDNTKDVMPGRFITIPVIYDKSRKQKIGLLNIPYKPCGIICCNIGSTVFETAYLDQLDEKDDCIIQVNPFICEEKLKDFDDINLFTVEDCTFNIETEIIDITLDYDKPSQYFFNYENTPYGLFMRAWADFNKESAKKIPARFYFIPGEFDENYNQVVSCCAAPCRPNGAIQYKIGGYSHMLQHVFKTDLIDLEETDNCIIQVYPIILHK